MTSNYAEVHYVLIFKRNLQFKTQIAKHHYIIKFNDDLFYKRKTGSSLGSFKSIEKITYINL